MNPPAQGLDRPVVALPIQVFPRPCEGAETFIARLAQANYLKPFYLRAYLCDPPMTAGGPLSWSRLAAATGRDVHGQWDIRVSGHFKSLLTDS